LIAGQSDSSFAASGKAREQEVDRLLHAPVVHLDALAGERAHLRQAARS
jgi:hypothetical protein